MSERASEGGREEGTLEGRDTLFIMTSYDIICFQVCLLMHGIKFESFAKCIFE